MNATPLPHPVGFVDFDGVWLDDPVSCSWALHDFSLVLEPRTSAAVVSLDGTTIGPALESLLTGARHPVRGAVRVDGVDLRDVERDSIGDAVVELIEVTERDAPERRFVVAGRTTVIADGRPASLEQADVVILVYGGEEVARGHHRDLLAAVPRYAQRFAAVAA